MTEPRTAEEGRLDEDLRRERYWKRWGPYLSERQWGTVREDYSPDGTCWDYFPHDHARSRAYRWGEDGLLGITDRKCRLCCAWSLWNGSDPILKERLFGLTGPEGNHGEDVKELYYYLDSTPTHSYLKALYKYPQREFPYAQLVAENRRRGKQEREFELLDTGVFDDGRYFDVFVEYAKASPNDILGVLRAVNRGPDTAPLDILPTLWFRNTWSWGRTGEGYWPRPRLRRSGDHEIRADHESLGRFHFFLEARADQSPPTLLFTENETNLPRVFGTPSSAGYFKDAFHDTIVRGAQDAVNPAATGTKAAAHYPFEVPSHGEARIRFRLTAGAEIKGTPFGAGFERVLHDRRQEADEFFRERTPHALGEDAGSVARQSYAGLLWSKQFYHYDVKAWLEGDPSSPPPAEGRKHGRNHDWPHLYNRDIVSMPDKWEYPWYAAWDLAFHMLPFARVDPDFAKSQLVLMLREWYLHPNGQIPAYEFAFSDVNPPVHAWAAWRVYKLCHAGAERDRVFLSQIFQKLLLNFTWWVNRKDVQGNHIFSGGFLGLDNIGVFDRSRPLPTGQALDQADGTAWMGFYSGTLLAMALELSRDNPATEDMASKFFEHFIAICDAINNFGGTGLWDEEDGFYYDRLQIDGKSIPLRLRSLVGLVPLLAVEVLEDDVVDRLPGFKKRLRWFLENRRDLASLISCLADGGVHRRLLAIPSPARLTRILHYMLAEEEFLSPYGIRSLSRIHRDHPYVFRANGAEYRVTYTPGESDTSLFGGNSNWRGPIWFPMNFLIIEALERYHHFFGDAFQVECPTGSGTLMSLKEVAQELTRRLTRLFLEEDFRLREPEGQRPVSGDATHWRNLHLFHEYFDGDSGRGLGASHQTGWTALVSLCLDDLDRLVSPDPPGSARRVRLRDLLERPE